MEEQGAERDAQRRALASLKEAYERLMAATAEELAAAREGFERAKESLAARGRRPPV